MKELRALLTALRNLEGVFDAYRITPSEFPAEASGTRLTLEALGRGRGWRRGSRRLPEEEDARALFVAAATRGPGLARVVGRGSRLLRRRDEQIGSGGFGGRPGPNRRLTVGYGVHEEHRGNGYATELLTLLADWALAQPGSTSSGPRSHPPTQRRSGSRRRLASPRPGSDCRTRSTGSCSSSNGVSSRYAEGRVPSVTSSVFVLPSRSKVSSTLSPGLLASIACRSSSADSRSRRRPS